MPGGAASPRSFRRWATLSALAWAAAAPAEVFEVGTDGALGVKHGGEVAMAGPAPAGPEDVPDPADTGAVLAVDLPSPALTALRAPDAPASFQPPLLAAARRYDLSPALLAALVWQESRWRADAVSPKGATGLAQLMPATARALAVDPRDAAGSLAGAAHYLRQLLDLFDGDVERALAAYNAGPARVIKAGGVPAIAETRAYVSAIMARLAGPAAIGAMP